MTTFTLNGSPRTVTSDPDTPLLYVLRDELGLNGAKFGCGLGQCGACTVLVDGDATFACITTIEGLSTFEHPRRLQQAFIDEQAAQCGYCISGMVMRTEGLLRRGAQPSEAEARAEPEPKLWRCGIHMRILRAVMRASGQTIAADAGAEEL
jgi:nicotinate dehydrogenase subunit A